MKSKFILLIIFFKFFLFFNSIYAENITIKSQEMSFNKDNEISTFKKMLKFRLRIIVILQVTLLNIIRN